MKFLRRARVQELIISTFDNIQPALLVCQEQPTTKRLDQKKKLFKNNQTFGHICMYCIFPSYNLEEINELVVDKKTNEAPTKTTCTPQMPLGQGSLPDLMVI